MKAIKETEEGVQVNIEVSPKSSHFTISGYNEWRDEIEVKIKAIPQKGKANQELIKEFSKFTSCDVEIVAGHKSRHKTLKVYGIDKKDFEKIVNNILKK